MRVPHQDWRATKLQGIRKGQGGSNSTTVAGPGLRLVPGKVWHGWQNMMVVHKQLCPLSYGLFHTT